MQRGVDVAIVGGGVMGCGLAWRLGERGLRVAVLERERPAAEASSAAAGILAAQIEMPGPSPLLDLALCSRGLYPAWADALYEQTGLHIGYRVDGALLLVGAGKKTSDRSVAEELVELSVRQKWQQSRGLRVNWLDSAALRELEPGLVESAGALYFPDDGQVEPTLLCAALAEAAARRGAQFIRATVERIESANGRVLGLSLVPADGTAPRQLAADRVVLCAGSWSAKIEGSSLGPQAVEPVRGQMLELRCGPGALRRVIFGQTPALALPALAGGAAPLHGYLVPRGDGRVLVGSTMERVGFVKEVTAAGLFKLLTLAQSLSPALHDATVSRTWSGLRPGSPDELPILGATKIAGLYVCTGHFRNGILLAPASIEALSALIVGDGASAGHGDAGDGWSLARGLDLAPFSPSRLDRMVT
jgi:glycine oxidase